MITRRRLLPLLACTALAPSLRAFALGTPDWTAPFPPHRIFANIYYVGTKDLAAFLVVTPSGNILINSNLESAVPQIQHNIETLGFKYADTRILLISHAHIDHAGGSARILRETGAKYMVMDDDVDVVESGGKTDFVYGKDPEMLYPAAKVDRVLHDGNVVTLGDSSLVARKTPGHTRGCTTWTMSIKQGNRLVSVVIVGSTSVNTGYILTGPHPSYPHIADNFAYTFAVLKSLSCDVFLGAHASYYDMEAKYAKLKQGDAGAFFDPQGYHRFIVEREEIYRKELAKQEAAYGK